MTKLNQKRKMSFSEGTGNALLGLCSLVGSFLTICLLQKIGKKPSVVGGYFGCGFSYLIAAVSYSLGFMEGALIGMCMVVIFW